MTKNQHDQKRKWILLAFITLCLFTFGYICFAPSSSIMTILIFLCLFMGYITFLFTKKLKKKSITLEKRRMTLHKKKQQRLLDNQRGKVIPLHGKKQE